MKQHIIPNLLKAAEVLRQIVAHDEGLTQAEVQRIVQLPKATAFRILNSWINEGFVRKVGTRYFAGIALTQAGLKSLKGMELRDQARPILSQLAHRSGETAHIAAESGAHSLILEVADSPNPVRAASRAGALADIHCSSTGKVFLAAKSNDEIEEVLERVILDPRTPNTHTSAASLMQDLENVRTNGYAVDDEEYYLGVRCLAAPVYDATGQLIAAIGITGTAEKLSVRSVGIRDLSGTLHIVPFSAVDTVSNYMREFGYHVGEYGVAYREDTDNVIQHLRAAFDELLESEEAQGVIIGELEVHGVTALADSSVNVRVRIKTLPGSQWAIGRQYNRLVKRHFDAADIEIPFPHTTIYFGQDKDGSAPPLLHRKLEEPERDKQKSDRDRAASASQQSVEENPEFKGDFDDAED